MRREGGRAATRSEAVASKELMLGAQASDNNSMASSSYMKALQELGLKVTDPSPELSSAPTAAMKPSMASLPLTSSGALPPKFMMSPKEGCEADAGMGGAGAACRGADKRADRKELVIWGAALARGKMGGSRLGESWEGRT